MNELQWQRSFGKRGVCMHILIVEDEKKLAVLLRRALLEVRHTVDVAHDGLAGLDLALSDTYDVIILDLMLPEI
ncbi:MAG TPA: response regulator, partial [Ktedonobacteraceae bacterium]|nr:response regulator [Ktedonobacteraceae bacterium]